MYKDNLSIIKYEHEVKEIPVDCTGCINSEDSPRKFN